jgi:MDMPI C-terminal domain
VHTPPDTATGPKTTAQALLDAAARTASLLTAVTDPARVASPTTWTIAETAAHIVAELGTHADLAENGRLPQLGDVSAAQRGRRANAEQLGGFAERDLATLAAQVVPAAAHAVDVIGSLPADRRIASSNALMWTPEQTLALLLGEQLLHGHDIAKAAGLPWQISRSDALLVAAGAILVLPDYLRPAGKPGRAMSFELRLRGGARYRLEVAGDTATVGPAGQPADCVITADPAAFVLVGYGRVSPLTAALTGRIITSGRKPWLGLAFGRLFESP